MERSSRRPAVFLDRDGTIIEDVLYLDTLDNLTVFPGAARALASLRQAGYALVLVTNQSGIGRGFFSEGFVGETHRELRRRFREGGVEWEAMLHCPHPPSRKPFLSPPRRRKPEPGMPLEAAARHPVTLRGSWVVGDGVPDMLLARRLGLPSVLVATGKGAVTHRRLRSRMRPVPYPMLVARHLGEAARLILRRRRYDSRCNAKARRAGGADDAWGR
ncbi:MAG: HAD family hydrolase [Synergistales bacterium]|nr:HAD family hydrolase [Synergistales bacterium]